MTKIVTSTFLISFVLLSILPASSAVSNQLGTGSRLKSGGLLKSSNGKYFLFMESDCDVVLYDSPNTIPAHRVWHTGTAGLGRNCELRMQIDGNLVVYNDANVALWQSRTYRSGLKYPQYYFEVQNDRNLVIYATGRKSQWSSGTKA